MPMRVGVKTPRRGSCVADADFGPSRMSDESLTRQMGGTGVFNGMQEPPSLARADATFNIGNVVRIETSSFGCGV